MLLESRHLLCRHEVGLHPSLYDVTLETLLHFAAAFESLVGGAQSQGASGDEPALLALVLLMLYTLFKGDRLLMCTNASTP